MKLRRILVGVSCVLALLVCSVEAQQREKFSARASVSVSCEDVALTDKVSSSIVRRIRAIGDVTVTNERAFGGESTFEIDVIAVQNRPGGLSLSLVVTKRFDPTNAIAGIMDRFGAERRSAEAKKGDDTAVGDLADAVWNLRAPVDHWLIAASDLDKACEALVERFEAHALERDRQAWQKKH